MGTHSFNLFADYYQFYVQDEHVSGIDGNAWGSEATECMVAVASGAIGVRTVRNTDVPVTIEILETKPPLDFDDWDNVTECSLATSSGKLVVAGWTDYLPDAARIDIAPGNYRARISGGGFDSVAKHRESGGDRYRVQLWPDSAIEPKVLKKRTSNTMRLE
jgi:hypothetical protein